MQLAAYLRENRWQADVNSFSALDDQIEIGPMYSFEYSTRAAYGQNIQSWGANDPLNATWWHLVTEGIQKQSISEDFLLRSVDV